MFGRALGNIFGRYSSQRLQWDKLSMELQQAGASKKAIEALQRASIELAYITPSTALDWFGAMSKDVRTRLYSYRNGIG